MIATAPISDRSAPPGNAGDSLPAARAGLARRLRRGMVRRALRVGLLAYAAALRVAGWLGRRPRRRPAGRPLEILLTGSFHSTNWIAAHLRPLAESNACRRVVVVSTFPIPGLPKVVAVYPPRRLRRLIGSVPARLLTFGWLALRRRPDVVGGFHLLVNGLAAALLARLTGARSLYFCVGGPMEVLDGGIWAENRVFGRLETPDRVVERRLVRAVDAFDLVVTMGRRAARFFRERGVRARFEVVPGGIGAAEFAAGQEHPEFDLILVGRLAAIKRIDVFLRAVAIVAQRVPGVTSIIVGDGELRDELRDLAERLGLNGRVRFAGHRTDVAELLRRARLFVLTSDSEGLALSLMEAMTCGLPAVVTDVGDLADLVEDGVNGYLVPRRSPEALADRIVELLTDDARRARFARAARRAAERCEAGRTARRWDDILVDLARAHPRPDAV